VDSNRILNSWPIRRKLLLLLLFIFLPAFGIIVISGLKLRHDEIAKAQNNATLLAQSLAAQQEQIATSTKVLLTILAQSPAVQHLDAKACNRLFRELEYRFPLYSAVLAVATTDGKLFAASKPFVTGAVNLADRKHFRDVIRTLDFSVGEYMQGRVSGVQSLNYTFPVLDAHRKLIAVVIAGFSLDEFAHFVAKADLPADYTVTIADWNGVRLFRVPENVNTAPGMPIARDSLVQASSAEQGFFERKSGDGKDRIYAFRQLRLKETSSPYMYVMVGVSKSEILHQANMQMVTNLTILGIAATLAMSLAWAFGDLVLVKPINRLVAASQHLGKGEMSVRTGLRHSADELGQLAKSFDSMASLLELRSLETRSAEMALSRANAELETRVRERTAELSHANAALMAEVTERKRAEAELAESRHNLVAALDAAKLGIWSRDLLTDKLVWDERTKEIYGVASTAEEVTEEQLLECIVPEDREVSRLMRAQQLQEADNTSGNFSLEYRVKVSGATRWVHVRGSILRDASGRPVRRTGVVMDITQRKQSEDEMRLLEEQFRHAQKMEAVGRLAGGIAHDFNNLLQVINGHSELIGDSPSLENSVRQHAEAILQAGRRAAQLTSHLLAFSRKQMSEPKIFELDQMVSGSEKMLRRIIPENIELTTNLHAGRARVKIAPVQLEQVIMNLVVNARDAMPAGGRLILETRCDYLDDLSAQQACDLAPGEYVLLAVSDSGHGMDAATRERIFEPFFTTKVMGTGLGLATVYGIVRQSGGGIHVYSEVASGSTFRIYLPLCREETREEDRTPVETLPTGTETVLLAEDESAVRILVRQHLEELGYHVLEAADGGQALALAKDNLEQIDIVVTDAIMPKMGGRELSENLRRLRSGLKILLVTGYAEGVLYDEIRAAGLELLPKPFSRRALARKLREMLDTPGPTSALMAEAPAPAERPLVV
jgi:PAS domain S-box-containing protein